MDTFREIMKWTNLSEFANCWNVGTSVLSE